MRSSQIPDASHYMSTKEESTASVSSVIPKTMKKKSKKNEGDGITTKSCSHNHHHSHGDDDTKKELNEDSLVHIHEVPIWLQFNRFILTGYRKPGLSIKACVKSLFWVHNETGNVWTHFLSLIIFIFWSGYTLFYYLGSESILHRFIFLVYLLSASFCFFSSTGYHLFSPNSESTMMCVAKLDYSGISGLIIGSVFPPIFYAFYCFPFWQVVYLGIIASLGLAGIIGSFFSFYHSDSFQTIRITLFAFTASFGLIPAVHASYIPQYDDLRDISSMVTNFLLSNDEVHFRIYLMYSLYVIGFLIYVTQFPECFFPGKFDYWFHSHQFWHIFVFAANAVHYFNLLNIYERWNSLHKDNCPMIIDHYYNTTIWDSSTTFTQ